MYGGFANLVTDAPGAADEAISLLLATPSAGRRSIGSLSYSATTSLAG
jgi:hypothetical protein